MGYMLIVDNENKKVEIHSDLCDRVFEKKDEFTADAGIDFVAYNLFEEIEEYLEKMSDYEAVKCDICKPEENKEELDEKYDDFYEEFDEDDEIDDTRCDII